MSDPTWAPAGDLDAPGGKPTATRILANPACLERAGLTADALVRLCAPIDPEAEIRLLPAFPGPDDWEALLARPLTRLIVAGGDGTIHHVVNALLARLARTGAPLPPIGLLPLGTANDFARSLGLPLELQKAVQTIAAGVTHPVDLGRVNDQYFLNVVHIGSLSETSRQVWPWIKHGIGGKAYALAVASTAWRIKPFRASWASASREKRSGWALHLAIANGRFFGGGMPIADEATLDDGQLDAALLPAWKGLRFPSVRRLRDPAITVDVTGAPPMSLDGEPFESTEHLAFRVLPGAIAVFTPASK